MSLDLPKIQDDIKDLVATGNVEKALDLLIETAEQVSEEKHNAALVLKVRFKNLQQDSSMGVLSANEENLEQARISKSLLELTDQLDDKDIIPTSSSSWYKILIPFIVVAFGAAAFFLSRPGATEQSLNTEVKGQLVFDNGEVGAFMIMNFNNGMVVDTTDAKGYYYANLPMKEEETIIVDISKDGIVYYDQRTLVGNLKRSMFKISKDQ